MAKRREALVDTANLDPLAMLCEVAENPEKAIMDEVFALPVFPTVQRTPEEAAEFLARKGARLLTSAEELASDRARREAKDEATLQVEARRQEREEAKQVKDALAAEKHEEKNAAEFFVAHLPVDALAAALRERLGVQEDKDKKGKVVRTTITNDNPWVDLRKYMARQDAIARWRAKKNCLLPPQQSLETYLRCPHLRTRRAARTPQIFPRIQTF